ncbi:hypothetical protein GCWU000282_00731 [Catonella morbi ATCC 51271]|uniref:Uncharacterized protein n=1 Tax=Catonella morbi ATCC 51271 TaxID=592026 RepID=V2Y4X0_9FIRM|nr:hypothetical protein [Catonella morbi]ESL04013.1 hypothetical protein GCWU000282_00731 [Catonella morbi ATCC 51271]
MYKKVRLVVKFSLLFMIIAAIYNYSAVSVMAANRIVKVKNGTSGEIRIKEDDFVTFIPKLKNNKNKKKSNLIFIIHRRMVRICINLVTENIGLVKKDWQLSLFQVWTHREI